MSDIVYPDPDTRPLADPRVRVYIEDGRFFLQTRSQRYDLITGEPPPPKAAGIVNLFTREYFALLRDRLAEGGIVSYWLPVHSLTEHEAMGIVRGFCEVFDDCTLWSGSDLDWILMGSRDARGPVSERHFTRQWRDPVVGVELRALGIEVPEQLGALFLAGSQELRQWTRDTPALDDDHPERIGGQPMVAAQMRPVYAPWLDVERAREAFLRDPVVMRLWPSSLREGSVPYFARQRVVNDLMGAASGNQAERLEQLDQLLETSSLRTLVVWQLGSSASAQRAAREAVAAGRRGRALDFEAGARALAERDFAAAAVHFERANGRGETDRDLVSYRVYALCAAGRGDEGLGVARAAGLADADRPRDRQLWDFLRRRCRSDVGSG